MRNRAKCKLCLDILESFHRYDVVTCKCGEISIDGGNDQFKCSAKNPSNFLRVDDKGNEILVEWKEEGKELALEKEPPELMSKEDKIKALEEMMRSIERLPPNAMNLPITHYDQFSLIALLYSILKN